MEDFKCRICGHNEFGWADSKYRLLACEGCGTVFNSKYKFPLNRKLHIEYLNHYNKEDWGELCYKYDLDSGIDLRAAISDDIIIYPYTEIKFGKQAHCWIPFGIKVMSSHPDMDIKIYCRSGLALKYGIMLSNCVGVVDNQYRGEVKGRFVNIGREPYTINPGHRVAQMVIEKRLDVDIITTESVNKDTDRKEDGFGSTGK